MLICTVNSNTVNSWTTTLPKALNTRKLYRWYVAAKNWVDCKIKLHRARAIGKIADKNIWCL